MVVASSAMFQSTMAEAVKYISPFTPVICVLLTILRADKVKYLVLMRRRKLIGLLRLLGSCKSYISSF